MRGLKGRLIGGAPYLPWAFGGLNRFFAFSTNWPWAWHGDLDWFKVKWGNEKEDGEDLNEYWGSIRIETSLRAKNLVFATTVKYDAFDSFAELVLNFSIKNFWTYYRIVTFHGGDICSHI